MYRTTWFLTKTVNKIDSLNTNIINLNGAQVVNAHGNNVIDFIILICKNKACINSFMQLLRFNKATFQKLFHIMPGL